MIQLQNRLFILTVFFILACTDNANSVSRQGPDVSGGGDTLVMNFKVAGRKVCDYLKTAAATDRSKVNPQEFCEAVERVEVVSQTRTVLPDGTEVDAINLPSEAKVILSRERNVSKGNQEFIQLAAHEYLSVAGEDDRNYGISGPLSLRMDMSNVESIQPGDCLQMQELYKVSPDYESGLQIHSIGNVYEINDRVRQPALRVIADGIERLVEEDRADRDYPYQRFIKIQCLQNGFRIEDRSNNFGSDPTGVYRYRRTSTYSSRIEYITFTEDRSQLTRHIKDSQTNMQTGESIQREEKTYLKRINH